MSASYQKNAGKISHTNTPEWTCVHCNKVNYPYLSSCRKCKKKKKINVKKTKYHNSVAAYCSQCNLEAWQHVLTKHSINLDDVLDVGCSFGSWLSRWKKMGFKKIKGIDANPEIKNHVSSIYDEFYSGTDHDIVKHYGTCNKTIAANAVVIHILKNNELKNFFNNIYNALDDDGYFMVSTVNAKYYNGVPNRCAGVSYHRYLKDYIKFIEDANFEIVDVVGTFISLYTIKKWLKPMSAINKGWAPFIALARQRRINTTSVQKLVVHGREFNVKNPAPLSEHWPYGELLFVTRKKPVLVST